MWDMLLDLEDFDCAVFIEYDLICDDSGDSTTPPVADQIDLLDAYHENGDDVEDDIWQYICDSIDTQGWIYDELLENASPSEPW